MAICSRKCGEKNCKNGTGSRYLKIQGEKKGGMGRCFRQDVF